MAEDEQDKGALRQEAVRYPAETMQERTAPPYLLALVALVADRDATDDLVAEVARDVSRGDGPDPAEESASRAAVEGVTNSTTQSRRRTNPSSTWERRLVASTITAPSASTRCSRNWPDAWPGPSNRSRN